MNYPEAPIKPVAENLHGRRVVDNYRWLENPKSKQVQAWVDAQNRLTEKAVPKTLRQKLAKEIERNFKYLNKQPPHKFGELYFWTQKGPDQEQHVLCVKEQLDGAERVLIDPNKLSGGKIISLDYWSPSKSGRYLVYGLSSGGNEISRMKLIDVGTAKNIEDVYENASFASVAWVPDESGFFYTRGPKPGSVPEGEERLHDKVYLHKLGTSSESDELIFGEGRPKEDMIFLNLSPDGSLLFITAAQDWVKNDLFVYELKTKRLRDLIVGEPALFYPHAHNQQVFLWTDHRAPNGKVIAADLDNLPAKLSGWREFIPETGHLLDYAAYTNKQALAVYMVDVASQVKIYDLYGRQTGRLELPAHSSILYISVSVEEDEYFYQYASFVNAGITKRYEPSAEKFFEYERTKQVLDPKDYIVAQEWYESKDGTKVPMFIIRGKKLKRDGKNPTILYGYGGFGSTITPYYLRSMAPWLKRGGIYAIANIRGGGEFGKKWHTGGILKNKQNSYDDFAAAAEYLIAKKYTDSSHLGIRGGSNGGLLVSAVAIQRPDLFRAVLSEVPLTDMVRFPRFLIAGRWMAEYGDPQKPDDLRRILKFSPYHNAKKGSAYPAFLFTTAENDTRVHPLHAWKMTALLQSFNGKQPVLLFTDKSTGHMGSLTMSNYYTDESRAQAFLFDQLGLGFKTTQ